MNKVSAINDQGNEEEFIILDSIVFNNTIYVIASEDEDDDSDELEATILKQIKTEDDYITYSFIEDEEEFNLVMSKFDENEDYDIEMDE